MHRVFIKQCSKVAAPQKSSEATSSIFSSSKNVCVVSDQAEVASAPATIPPTDINMDVLSDETADKVTPPNTINILLDQTEDTGKNPDPNTIDRLKGKIQFLHELTQKLRRENKQEKVDHIKEKREWEKKEKQLLRYQKKHCEFKTRVLSNQKTQLPHDTKQCCW